MSTHACVFLGASLSCKDGDVLFGTRFGHDPGEGVLLVTPIFHGSLFTDFCSPCRMPGPGLVLQPEAIPLYPRPILHKARMQMPWL